MKNTTTMWRTATYTLTIMLSLAAGSIGKFTEFNPMKSVQALGILTVVLLIVQVPHLFESYFGNKKNG